MGKALLFEPPYRNPSEKFLGHLLETAGVPFAYEAKKLEYSVPARTAKYLPDFCITGTNILLEYKGWFGRNGAKERQKLLLLKQQYPDLDIRLVFSNAKNKIYTGSPTTYAAWADENGFQWCEVNKARGRTTLPASWVKDMKSASKGTR